MTSVLILAGSRDEACPLCEGTDVASKGLLPLRGVRMIDHMLRALRDTPELTGDVWISGIDPSAVSQGAPADLVDFVQRLKSCPIAEGPARATLAAIEGGADIPLLITTCDHPLLSPAMIRAVIQGAEGSDCDVAVGLARRTLIRKAYPEAKRTYVRLGGEGYSGCNLFLLRDLNGLKAVEFWRQVGLDRKKPVKIALRFGLGALMRMLLGQMELEHAFDYGSERVGAKIVPVIIPIAEAAIDVDKAADLILVRKILAEAV